MTTFAMTALRIPLRKRALKLLYNTSTAMQMKGTIAAMVLPEMGLPVSAQRPFLSQPKEWNMERPEAIGDPMRAERLPYIQFFLRMCVYDLEPVYLTEGGLKCSDHGFMIDRYTPTRMQIAP